MREKFPTAADICEQLRLCSPDQSVAGNVLKRISAIESATPDAMVFASSPEMLVAAIGCAAGLILAGPGSAGEARIVCVQDPRTAFAQVYARWFAPVPHGLVDPAAIVADSARIGRGTSIGAGSIVEQGTAIGEDCRIGPRVTIHSGTTLGDRVVVQSGAVLGSTGFGYVSADGRHLPFPQIGTLRIEDDVEIGANSTIDRGALGATRIGRGTKIDNLVHIAHNCQIGEHVLIAAQVGMAGSTVIEDHAMLGGQVGLGERVTIGRGVVLGGQGGVLPGKRIDGEGVVYWGTPAQPVREYLRDLARLRRRATRAKT